LRIGVGQFSFQISVDHNPRSPNRPLSTFAQAEREVSGIAHGTALFYGGPDAEPAQRILRFIDQYAPAK
jgi:hypothetical protein